MNSTDLLAAMFADHESEAPDVTQTRLGIEAALARRARRRPPVSIAPALAVATVIAIALAAALLGVAPTTHVRQPSTGHGTAARPNTSPPAGSTSAAPQASVRFPFHPGSLPPDARFGHSEVGGGGRYCLQDYTFGSVPSQARGLTLWSDTGPLPTRLRDGGKLRPTTIHGDPAVAGWSPSSHSYLVAVLRPHDVVISVLAYGWKRATTTSYALDTARHLQYGSFPRPTGSN